ncbi:MAG: AAA family ATPase, partial [Hyphomicrobiales bacterium]|nr:AAA family ATPase [Hyphomicrobiales bacterium]
MASATAAPDLRNAHVLVVGNEKGGTGKSTLSIHIIIALLKAGYRVASIDLDTRQRTLTRFLENRQSWGAHAGRSIELPYHHALERGGKDSVGENEIVEFTSFAEAISRIEHEFEFVVIDTPASDSYLMRLAHSLADTLVTPMNDSFIDVDVLARVHNDRRQRGATAQYAALVLESRRQRRLADAGLIDWVVVRNRMASLQSHNQRQVAGSLGRLSPELQFRMAEGLGDRVIFRELFPVGLTVLDSIEEVTEKGALSASQIAARGEVKALVETLRLP